MKKWIIATLAVLVVTGCSTTVKTPKPVEGEYTFQAFYVSVPVSDFDQWASNYKTTPPISSFTYFNEQAIPVGLSPFFQDAVESLFENPNAEIVEFPVVRAGVGESITIDQTTTVYQGVDADIIDGEVVYKKEPIDLGKRLSLTIVAVNEDKTVMCQIHPMYRKLIGKNSFPVEGDLVVEMPKYRTISVDTFSKSLILDAWVMLRIYDPYERNDGTQVHGLLFGRLLPPK